MREWILRVAAGVLAFILLAGFLVAVLGIDPAPQSLSDDASVPEGYEHTWGYYLALMAGFFCDSIPLAWIALRGLRGRKSRLMLWALMVHVVIGMILLPGVLIDYEEASGGTLILVIPLQLLWIVYYLAVLGSRYFRDLLPSREYGSR